MKRLFATLLALMLVCAAAPAQTTRLEDGWKFALAVKIARCIRFKPCLQQDQYLSSKAECKIEARRLLNTWLTKPQKKIYNQFLILEAEQQELPFYD